MHRQVRRNLSKDSWCWTYPWSQSTSSHFCLPKWVRQVVSTVQVAWSLEVVSNRNRLKMFYVDTWVCFPTPYRCPPSPPTHELVLVEYVTCKTCKSPDTLLTKENRIFFMACETCGSRRSVNPIKTGFQAQLGCISKSSKQWAYLWWCPRIRKPS